MKTNAENFKSFPKLPKYLVGKTGMILDSETGEMITPHLTGGGKNRKYERVILKDGDLRLFEYVHRMVAITWIGDHSATDLVVHHKNNNSFDNSLENLEWTTQRRNTALGKKGSRNKGLDPETVAEIRILLEAGKTHDFIYRNYDVGPMALWRIKTGKTYKSEKYEIAYENFKDTSLRLY